MTFYDFLECGRFVGNLGNPVEGVCTVNGVISVYHVTYWFCCHLMFLTFAETSQGRIAFTSGPVRLLVKHIRSVLSEDYFKKWNKVPNLYLLCKLAYWNVGIYCSNDKSFGSKDDVRESERVIRLMCLAFKLPTKVSRFGIQFDFLKI